MAIGRDLDDPVRQDPPKNVVLLMGPQAHALQLVRDCKAAADLGRTHIRDAAPWLASLET